MPHDREVMHICSFLTVRLDLLANKVSHHIGVKKTEEFNRDNTDEQIKVK